MEPIDPNEVYGDRFEPDPNYEPHVYFNDEGQTIQEVIRTWGDVKLLSEEEHIEDEREYFKRKLMGK